MYFPSIDAIALFYYAFRYHFCFFDVTVLYYSLFSLSCFFFFFFPFLLSFANLFKLQNAFDYLLFCLHLCCRSLNRVLFLDDLKLNLVFKGVFCYFTLLNFLDPLMNRAGETVYSRVFNMF